MATYYFVWLGSKRAKRKGTPEKGWRLDMAARAGLPVPPGGIFLDDVFWLALQENIVMLENGRITIPSPQALTGFLYTTVRFPRLNKPCAVRPLPSAGITAVSPALFMDMNDAGTLAKTLRQMWTTMGGASEECRHDILIQEMVEGEIEGTAVSRKSSEADAYFSNGEQRNLPKLGRWDRTDPDAPHYAQRLQKLLRGLRRTFGAEDWLVHWLDDGRVCWLLQISDLPSDLKQI